AQVDAVALEIGERSRYAGACHLRRRGRCGDRRRYAVEDQERRRQKAAADTEHARQEADPAAEQDDDQRIDRQVGDRKIEIQGQAPKRETGARAAPIPQTLDDFSEPGNRLCRAAPSEGGPALQGGRSGISRSRSRVTNCETLATRLQKIQLLTGYHLMAPRSVPRSALRGFLESESAGGILLILAAALAMIVANSSLGTVYH